jgi:hypothetical protein
MPAEQSADDRKSLVFNSAPLASDLEILGYPIAKVRVAADVPVAKLAVRLTEVTPEGKSWLVSYGLLNITHRSSHEHPSALVPGQFYDVEIKLFMVAHRFKRGHTLRLALSEGLWPLVWPSPQVATVTIETGGSSLVLPVRPPPAEEAPFSIPVHAGRQALAGAAGNANGESTLESPEGIVTVTRNTPEKAYTLPDVDTTLIRGSSEVQKITAGMPNSCLWKEETVAGYKRNGWDCRTVAAYEVTSTAEAFLIKESLKVTKGSEVFFEQETVSKIDRDLV